MTDGPRAEIRLGAIRHNLELIKNFLPGAPLMAVVKANAYGHGICEVANAIADVDCLAVARIGEAARLREADIATPIVVLGGAFSAVETDKAASLDVQLVVHNPEQVTWLEQSAMRWPVIWMKIDSGMNRLGFRLDDAGDMIRKLTDSDRVGELRLMTHFASADRPDSNATSRQVERFFEVIEDFDGAISVANSPAVFGWRDLLERVARTRAPGSFWLRPGLALYGLSPVADQRASGLGLEPAMRLVSPLVAVKPLPAGEAVGYGGTWTADRDTTLGVIAAGYGDGYSRHVPSGTPVVVNERRVPVIGRVSMDLTAVDLGPDAEDRVGDDAELWGPSLPLEEVAMHADTITYTLACAVGQRVERHYVD